MKKPMVKEEDESPADEAAESPEQQTKEKAEGIEMHEAPEEGETSGAKIPEAFQAEVDRIVDSCSSMAQVDYISSSLNEKREKLYSVSKPAPAQNFSEEDMPSE